MDMGIYRSIFFTEYPLLSIPKMERHNRMIECLSGEDPIREMYQEQRKLKIFHELDEEYGILLRPDMENRILDFVQNDSNSFYACLSKEIFGLETNTNIIRKRIKEYFETSEESSKDILEAHIQGIDEGLEPDDIDIQAAAQAFQTKFYILHADAEGNSEWKEFSHRPSIITKKNSCRSGRHKSEHYCVTLFKHFYGRYSRIVPRTKVCNCQLSRPQAPGRYPLKTRAAHGELY